MFCSRNLSISFALAVCAAAALLSAQESGPKPTAVVPSMVNFPGTLADSSGKPMTGVVGVTFFLYREPQGGAPLWMETQNVRSDKSGHYSAMLGSTTSQGLPANLFVSGEARWLGVQISGQPEQPRVLLLSVPYAMKAADAETLGGLPLSAFVLATPTANGQPSANFANGSTAASTQAGPPPASSTVTTAGGTVNAIPLFTTATNIQNSILTQTGATAVNVGGKLNLPAQGVATATGGKFSRPEAFVASAFNSASSAAVAQTFQVQVEPAGNNTAAPSGTLNFLYGSGTGALTETGLKINSKGLITFATGQTFPGGGGKGTITAVVPGVGLIGGGTTGSVTLGLDGTKVPELSSNNTFSGTEHFAGNTGIGAVPSGNGYTPLSVGGATSFGTWLSLANTSSGGHTWNIISAGSGNAEGAGNLGITDLTGKSTIWLEGNTNTNNLTATGNLGGATMVVTSTAGAAIIDADGFGKNAGGPTPGLRFGGGSSGEGIASNRVIGLTKFGLDFYTEFAARMSILQNGQVGIGTQNPGAGLAVVSSVASATGIYAQAANAASGSNQAGGTGLEVFGGSGDLNGAENVNGGTGMTADGGLGVNFGGDGGDFTGSANVADDAFGGGDGIVAIVGSSATGSFAPDAGFFSGQITVTQGVNGSVGILQMDHPLDPANKLLQHAAVESPDMKNIYDGNITTDAAGEAVVELPEYFEALNRDFRYQLTVIGQFAQAIVANKIANNRFTVHTDKPNVEVSWQVTGIRKDAWANAHRVTVEPTKTALYQGRYLHPELYGAPEEASFEWARHPQIMKRQKEMRQMQQRKLQAGAAPRLSSSPEKP
jgi:hypothetical protein